MPTVPPFEDDDAARRKWLQAWFVDKHDFDAWKASWHQAVQRSDAAVTYAGYLGTALVTIFSTIQSGFSLTENADPEVANVLNYIQTAIGLAGIAVGVGAKISKGIHEQALRDLNREFPTAFFVKFGALAESDVALPSPSSVTVTGSINRRATEVTPLLTHRTGAAAVPPPPPPPPPPSTAAPTSPAPEIKNRIWGPDADPSYPERRLHNAARRWINLC